MKMNMKHTTALASLVMCLASTLTTVHAKDRGWNREPNPIPNPPRTFDRASKTFDGGNGKDDCFKWEARENNGYKEFGPVICRQKCPPGYGTSKDKCVWQQTFTTHIRLQNLVRFGDSCIEDNGPQTFQVKQSGTQVAMTLQLKEVKLRDREGRTTCAATCPTEFGWADAGAFTCVFKENYKRRRLYSSGSSFDACYDQNPNPPANCMMECAPGYTVNPKNSTECAWRGRVERP